MRHSAGKVIALSGMLSAVAIVIMCLGGLVPLATFICPLLCTLTGHVVLRTCGRKIAWCWYGATAIISLLLCPDKESAAVFLFLGYYPFVKPWLDKCRFGWIGKVALFNGAIAVLYLLLRNLLGMEELSEEYRQLGFWGGAVMVLLGNITFFLLDRLLNIMARKK